MTDKELIRRALMGDQEAQQECTEKGIVLPCPFCGSDSKVFADIDLFGARCVDSTCIGHDMRAEYYFRGRAIEDWNTRPAPPVGRCGECKYFNHFFNAVGHCMIHSQEKDSFGDGYRVEMLKTDFCSYFEPREE